MQRYDSIHNTNISGLVNTNNKVEHKKKSRQNVIVESKDFYIENRLHSQTIFEENGDIWVMYPRIKNNSVDGLLIASYTNNGTNVYFSYVKKNSKLYTANINLFQEKFDKQINAFVYNKSNGGLCGYGDEVCELDGPIIVVPNPGGGGFPYPGGGDEPNPGGGCAVYEDCEYIDPDPGGGGGGETPTKTPCEGINKMNDNYNFQNKLKGLQNSLKNSSTEEGLQILRNYTNSNIPDAVLSPNSKTANEVSFSDYENTIGYVHSHRNSDNVRGIFSVADLEAFWTMVNGANTGINNGSITNYNLYDLFSILVINDGMYMLRVYDVNLVKNTSNEFKKNIYKEIRSFMSENKLRPYFNDTYQDMNESDKVFNDLNSLLKKLGFAVYKAKKNGTGYSSWERLDKNGNIKCN
ncbi:MAG: hypothetical protein ACRC8Z_11915 [Empedobacter falsenii]